MSDPLLSISMGGDSGAADRLRAFDAVAALRGWGAQWGPKVTAAIQAVVPGDSGGPLEQSITFAGVRGSSGGVSMSWTTDKEYAAYLIEGTAAHGPASAPMLHWVGDGGDVFAKWVSGIAPDTFPLSEAVEGLLPAMGASLAEVFEEI